MNVSTLTRHDHSALLNFLDHQPDVHYHLDWESVEQWLRDSNTIAVLAREGDRVIGSMAFTPPHGGTTWLRLLALPFDNRLQVFGAMWRSMQILLTGRVRTAAAMIHRQWVADTLADMGFLHIDSVINLARKQQPIPQMSLAPVRIRRPRRWELSSVLAVDHAAFGPLWQMRDHDLREAGHRATRYTVAHDGERLVGYQLSIRYGRSLHLARLAILPEAQNQGVGRALVHDLLNYAQSKGIEQVTVNTQHSNLNSQRLYERMGFEPDGSSLPVFIWEFSASPPEIN